jgi:hypothetical protein
MLCTIGVLLLVNIPTSLAPRLVEDDNNNGSDAINGLNLTDSVGYGLLP